MPRVDPTPKEYRGWDRAVVAILEEMRQAAGISGRTLAARAGMSQNRTAIILRGETPPATVGEIDSLAQVLGGDAITVVQKARARLDSD
ncbi:MAG: helix-turn-helix domain-containing protein [Micrococcales bacterium]|nr:helix-turn-helix domain-containing protein [Micrococcales bacterium]